MKSGDVSKFVFVLLAGVALTVYGCASGSGAARNAASGSGPASDVASMLNGNYRYQEGDADVRLDVSSTSGVGSSFSLLATASGRLDGRNLSDQSIIRLQTEGPDVMMTIIPHFGEPLSTVSLDVDEPSPRELDAACTLYLRPYDEGWAGAPPGTGTCVQAITGATGQWQVEIQPGEIRFIDGGKKRVLAFRKTEGRGR